MKAGHGRKRWWVLIVGGGLVGLLAAVGAGFVGMGTNPVPVAHAGANPNDGWVTGDQSGSLIGLDPEGKFTQAFPLKHTDVSIQVSGYLIRALLPQQVGNSYFDNIEAVYS